MTNLFFNAYVPTKVLFGAGQLENLHKETGRKLNRPKWKIIPVTYGEVECGIWRECPF